MWWSNPGWKRRGEACKSTLLEAGHANMTPLAIISCTVQNREHVWKTAGANTAGRMTRQGDWSQFNFVRTTHRPKKRFVYFFSRMHFSYSRLQP